jgi:hypothetical protein
LGFFGGLDTGAVIEDLFLRESLGKFEGIDPGSVTGASLGGVGSVNGKSVFPGPCLGSIDWLLSSLFLAEVR